MATTVEDSVATYLESQSSVTDLLKSTTSIVTDYHTQAKIPDSRPFIYVELVHDDFVPSVTTGTVSLNEALIDLHCEATTLTAASNIADKIRLLFKAGFRGTMGSLTVRTVNLVDRSNRPSGIVSGNSDGLPASILRIQVFYQQPTS